MSKEDMNIEERLEGYKSNNNLRDLTEKFDNLHLENHWGNFWSFSHSSSSFSCLCNDIL